MPDPRLDQTFDFRGRVCRKYEVKTDEDGEDYIDYTPQWQDYLRDRLILQKLSEMGLSEDCLKFGFETYKGADSNGKLPKLAKYVVEFKNRYRKVHLYFWSRSNSTQKSTMAKAILVKLLSQGIDARFVLMSDLLRRLTDEAFHPENTEILDAYRSAAFLVIDDSFDPNKATIYKSGYQFAFLDTFLRQRLEVEKRATCFTSNVPISEIEKNWTTSISKLVQRSIPDPMEFQDHLSDFSIDDLWS